MGLLLLAMGLLVLLGSVLRGKDWLIHVVAHPERQSLFRLGWMVLAQGPPPYRDWAVEELRRLLQELRRESD